MNRKLLVVFSVMLALSLSAAGCSKKNDAKLAEHDEAIADLTAQLEEAQAALKKTAATTAAAPKAPDPAPTERRRGDGDGNRRQRDNAPAAKTYDYSKVAKGDLSELAGTWVDVKGDKLVLKADGSFDKADAKADNFRAADGGSYTWRIRSDTYSVSIALYPVGAKFDFDGSSTDDTKNRLNVTSSRLGWTYLCYQE